MNNPKRPRLFFGLLGVAAAVLVWSGLNVESAISFPLPAVSGGNGTLPVSPPPLSLFTKARFVLRDKCMACHTQDYTLPVYSHIPGLRDLIEREYLAGLRHLNLAAEFSAQEGGQGVGEAALAKIERSLDDATMPPPQYVTSYLSAQLTTPERSLLREWIYATREACFATGLAAPQFAHEPLQPLPAEYVEPESADDFAAALAVALGEQAAVSRPSPEARKALQTRKAALGEALYHDRRISVDGTVSCASCHPLNRGGMDNREHSPGTRAETPTNTPTVFNAALNFRQLWNGATATLAEQALVPPVRPSEMGPQSWEEIVRRLKAAPDVRRAMEDIYPDGVTAANVTDALGEFEKTLLTPHSRFDRYLMGDMEALSVEEKLGYDLFKEARCATCHVGRAVGGQSMEYLDLKKDFYADRGGVRTKDDLGLAAYSGREADRHKFKTPILRNTAITGPWFHDGSVKTLDEAIRLMCIYQSGVSLSGTERGRIAAFLKSLTGMYKGRPVGSRPEEQPQS